MTGSQPNLRKASEKDAGKLLSLVRELAVYEKCPDQVKTTPEDYVKGLKSGLFSAFILEQSDGELLGMALYFPYFSTWGGKTLYLEDFIVREKFRGLGFGKLIFDAVLQEAKDMGAKKVKWQVLDWNEPARMFYRSYGAQLISGWDSGVIEFDNEQ